MEPDSTREPPGLLERLFFGRDCLYREGRAGYWESNHFDKWYEARTPWGFKVLYRVRGVLKRVDNSAFNKAELLDKKNIEVLVDHWNEQAFRPSCNSSCFTLGFSNLQLDGYEQPVVWTYRLTNPKSFSEKRPGRPKLEIDPNSLRTLAGIREHVWRKNGCAVELVALDTWISSEIARENYAMLTPAQIEAAEKDERVAVSTEVAAVAALEKLRRINDEIDRAYREHTLDNEFLKVATAGLGNKQTISWVKQEGAGSSRWEVIGFREEGGFSEDPYSEDTSSTRIRVAHSNLRSGTTADYFEPATSYYYTFFIKDAGQGEKKGYLRFSVRALGNAEQRREFEELAAAILWLKNRQKDPPPKVDDGRMIDIEALRKYADSHDQLADFLNTMEANWQAKEVDEDEILHRLAGLRAMAREMIQEKK